MLRNSPTLYNVAYQKHLFLDGREISLENQVWQPMTAHNEMAAPSIGYVIRKLRRMRDYEGMFERAFDGRGPDVLTIGQALASYQRTLLAADSPFDRWYFGGRADAVDESVKRGFALFSGKAQCIACHRVREDHALFIDHRFHNTGLGYAASVGGNEPDTTRVQLAPGVFAGPFPGGHRCGDAAEAFPTTWAFTGSPRIPATAGSSAPRPCATSR